MLPEPHVCSLLRACIQARTHLNAQQLAVVLSALPRLNIRPSRTWMTTMLFSHPHLLRSFTHHELALTVFSLGCMRMQPPEDWMQLCTQQVRKVSALGHMHMLTPFNALCVVCLGARYLVCAELLNHVCVCVCVDRCWTVLHT